MKKKFITFLLSDYKLCQSYILFPSHLQAGGLKKYITYNENNLQLYNTKKNIIYNENEVEV